MRKYGYDPIKNEPNLFWLDIFPFKIFIYANDKYTDKLWNWKRQTLIRNLSREEEKKTTKSNLWNERKIDLKWDVMTFLSTI